VGPESGGGGAFEGDAAWYVRAFGDAYIDVYGHRDAVAAAREVAWITARLGVAPGDRLLDLGCGAGRHARAFAAAGADVVGADLSAALLFRAVRGARGGARFVRADVRALPFRAIFRHVVSLFTSFGYFDDAGDRAHLAEVRRVLVQGGSFLLDFLNAPRVAASLVPESERVLDAGQAGERRVREQRVLRAGRVEKDVEVRSGDRLVASWRESVRLHSRQDLEAMFADVGLLVVGVHGDLAGSPWSEASDRLVLVARAR
jgi:SAM-dependent methyltransferase